MTQGDILFVEIQNRDKIKLFCKETWKQENHTKFTMKQLPKIHRFYLRDTAVITMVDENMEAEHPLC